MNIVYTLLQIALVAVIVWALTTYLPMKDIFKQLLTGAGVILCILLILYSIGLRLP